MKLKKWQNFFHVIVNTSSIVQHVIQIKNGIMKHDNVSVKIIAHAKKIIVWFVAHVFARMMNIKYLVNTDTSVITSLKGSVTYV